MKSLEHYYRVNRRDIALLQFLVEAYEGVALVSTVDPQKGLVCLRVSEHNRADYQMMLQGIREHFPMEPIDPRKWGIAEE